MKTTTNIVRFIAIVALFALCTPTAWGQEMPERSLVRRGNRAYEDGDFVRAAQRYEQALLADPTSSEALYNNNQH